MENSYLIKKEDYSITETWSVQDVMDQATRDRVIVTVDDAIEILDAVKSGHDSSIGINWDVISHYIRELVTEKGRENYQYDVIEYGGIEYVYRVIPPILNTFSAVIAPSSLKEALKKEFGNEVYTSLPVLNICAYVSLDEIVLPDKELYLLFVKQLLA